MPRLPVAPRLALPADRPAVEDVVRQAYTPYIARIGRPPGPMTDDYPALIAAGHVHLLERDGAVAAVLVLVEQPGVVLLDNIAVHPAFQGTGLGRVLLDFAEETARRRGYGAVRLYTNEAMTENLALYARRGYRETHRAEEKGLRRVYMLKPLR